MTGFGLEDTGSARPDDHQLGEKVGLTALTPPPKHADANAVQRVSDPSVDASVDQTAKSVEDTLNKEGAVAALKAVKDQTASFQKEHTDYASQKAFADGLTKRLTDDKVMDSLRKEATSESTAATSEMVDKQVDQVATNVETTLYKQGSEAALKAVKDQTIEFQKAHPDAQKGFSDELTERLTKDKVMGALQEEATAEAVTSKEQAMSKEVGVVARKVEATLREHGPATALKTVRDQTVAFQKAHSSDGVAQAAFSDALTRRLTDDKVMEALQNEAEKEAQ